MKLGYGAFTTTRDFRTRAGAMERAGYDTLLTTETQHDPFVTATILAERTQHAEIMTAIAVAFARTPMVLALAAHELNAASGGRFHLGLGSQIKAHITRRFSMPWSHPARRMKELIAAMHAIWDCWYDGKPLKFEGEFYTHTLMTPYFTPTEKQFGRPKVHLAAVGELMTAVAGEVADGMICHAFTSERYVREVTLPLIEKALAQNGRSRADFELTGAPFIATGENEATLLAQIAEVKGQIAFYGSTPAYRGVLDLHGWGPLHEELNRLSKTGQWEAMSALITDEVLDAFAVTGTGNEVAAKLRQRYGGLFERMAVRFDVSDAELPAVLGALKG